MPILDTATGFTWKNNLSHFGEEITDLSSSSEADFLEIGSKLQDFYFRSQEMSKIASSAASLILGDELNSAIKGLHQLLERMNYYLKKSDEDLEHNSSRLHHILTTMDDLRKPLEDFKKIVKMLTMMGISTKIENARFSMGEGGFDTLADDIKNLSSHIKLKSSSILEQSLSVSTQVKKTITSVTSLETRQKEQMRLLLDKTTVSVKSLEDINIKSYIVAGNISKRSDEISANIGEVVSSIQFHDITRQQMEHVKEAFDDMIEWLTSQETLKDHNIACDIKDVCELQIAQLKNSLGEFHNAVSKIINNLHAIENNISNMSSETKNIVGDVNKTGGSILANIEHGMSSVGSSLIKSSETSHELSGAMKSAVEKVKDLSAFVNDIIQTGLKVELIALNAQIKAAHTGKMGAALCVIAESVQQLAVDSRSHTDAILGFLNNISSYAKEIFMSIDSETQEKDTNVEGMIKELNSLITSIDKLNNSIASYISNLEESRQKLAKDIDKTINNITVHHTTEKLINSIVKGLEVILLKAGEIGTQRIGESIHAKYIENLKSRYTMESERKIHILSISSESKYKTDYKKIETTKSPVPDKNPGRKLSTSGNDNIGDNIELFGDPPGDNIELFGDSDNLGDNIELFGDSDNLGDNIELFGDPDNPGDNIELFGDPDNPGDNIELFGESVISDQKEEDLGDNVELF